MHCPACGNKICPPSGKSNILVIGDAPDNLDMINGTPFSTHEWSKTGGYVLRKELNLLGCSLSDFRVTTMWLHEPNKDDACWNAGFDHVLDEAKGKKAILLIGADTVSAFTKFKVSDVTGLQVDSHILSAPIIYAMINPGLALHRSYGEVRFALTNFVNRLNEEGLL